MTGTTASAEPRLETLSAGQANLLQLLLEQKSRQAASIPSYPRQVGPRGLTSPTSWAQQRLWFIDRLEGGSAAYHIPVTIRLRRNLDVDALKNALSTIVQRHEVLRTVFGSSDGDLHQEISTEGQFALKLIDLRHCAEGEHESQVQLQEHEEAQEKFDLSVGPLIRGRLLCLADDNHVLLVTMHHIISDEWSMAVFIRELAELYNAYRDGRDNPIEPLQIQYSDYAQWQRQWLQTDVLDKQLSYWRVRMEGAAPQLELPADRPRPPVQSYRGQCLPVVLDSRLSAKVKAFAQEHQITLFMALYAGWAILLSRLSAQTDVVIGTPIANRQKRELERLVGLFANTLVLRTDVQSDLSVMEFLQHVKGVTLGAYDHQDVPFEQVVEALHPQRSLSRNPLFQVMLVLQNAPKSDLQLSDLRSTVEYGENAYAKFDLLLSLEDRGDEIAGFISYATDLFDRHTVERWMRCFTVLMESLTTDSQCRIADLPLLPVSGRNEVINVFNATDAAYPRQKLVHELFEEQAERTPDAEAVSYEQKSLTFAELNGRANQLAHHLRKEGVGPDDLVALCVERSLEMVVGLLGVLKAGGAYVPLDPNYPPERLAYMLQDAAPKVLLTQARIMEALPRVACSCVALDEQWEAIAENYDSNLETHSLGLTPQNLAYVIYTSGSTGQPKGVMVEHASAVNFWCVLGSTTHRECRPNSRIGLNAAYTFDMSLKGLLQLLSGHSVVIIPQAIRADGEAMLRFIDEERIDAFDSTPSQLDALLRARLLEKCVRPPVSVLLGGEAISPAMWGALKRSPVIHFFNMYGPTECTVDATIGSIRDSAGGPNIGKPIANTRVYILDARLQPVPIGVVGEMYIAGVGVARGYLNRPELTAERFIRDPFNSHPRARLYKTGDLGRWRSDGTIEYLGRNDHQVKIRGFRVELGEIEAQLARHAQVKNAVVTIWEDASNEKRLVAYVIPSNPLHTGSAPSVETLRLHLKSMLPEHAIPSAFVMLERFPLTANGKVDRSALPAPDLAAYARREYEAPQGEVEEVVAGIWQGLLRVERVGRRDNFFELGGHSLLIMQMMERLRRVGLSTEIRSVYESQTLADLAAALTKGAVGLLIEPPNLIPPECDVITPQMLPLIDLDPEHIQQIVRTVPGGAANIQDIYPLAPLQEGILFHHLLDEHGADTYVLSTALAVSSRERLDELIAALQDVVDRHDVLRTAVLWEQLPRAVQVVYRRATLPVEEVTWERDPGDHIDAWIASERQRLDLREAPLLRLRIGPAADGQWYALLLVHHIICDHVTEEVLISEVVARLKGHAPRLPETAPYRSHVAQALAYSKTHDAEAFFRSKLSGVDEPTAPYGLMDVHGDGSQIEEAREQLEPALAQRIRAQARRLGVSAATLFHAAWGLVVAGTTGRDDVVFGSVLLGRLQGDASGRRMLGMFINTLPLRLRLSDVTAKELIEQTQRELVELLSHEQASLAVAQRCSGIAGSAPLFTALLNYRHSVPNLAAEWTSAAGIRLIAGHDRTSYPLTLSVDDLGEGFSLTAQTDRRIDPRRVAAYVIAGMQSLVDALEQSPQTRALSLSILPGSELRRVVEGFNPPRKSHAPPVLIHNWFEQQVAYRPSSVAVVYGGQAFTYTELNSRSNQLAHYLRDKGVGPDRLVGIYAERGLDLVVGLLGILKAGGAYLPLDPNYPAERLAYMLKDAAPAVLLTQERLKEKLPETSSDVITLDSDWTEIDARPTANLDLSDSGLRPDHLAYVIYTSGSTGEPKGVMVEHRQVTRLFAATEEWFGFNERDVWTLFHSVAFDFSVWELWGALLYGGRVVVVPYLTARSPQDFYRLLCAEKVTILNQTPSAFAQLIQAQAESSEQHSLRVVIFGGEALELRTLRPWVDRYGDTPQLVNMYGITETTVHVTYRPLTKEEILTERGSPIGTPIPDLRSYLLDGRGQPVPIGVTGEIYVGGAGVARGYLNRPELTAQRFLHDPFSADANARMYKTGDLGQWREDGIIEYRGRNDHQVKIRGFRIELGEIEGQLVRHEHVRDAVVVAREDVPGQKRLVAYVIPAALPGMGQAPTVDILRAHLKTVLPEYMVPSAFVMLERLPLTSNGKLDRRALPAPELGDYSSRQYQAPQGQVEEVLAGIWQSLLRAERVGRQDNFFELGGHSLLIVQMKERLRRVGLSADIRRVFESPTLADLASSLTREAGEHLTVPPNLIPPGCEKIEPSMLPLVELEPEDIERIVQSVPGGAINIQDIYPLAPLQEGILFHHLLDKDSGDAYVLASVLVMSSREQVEALIAALQAVMDRHDILRMAILWEQLPRPVQVVYRHAVLPVEEITLDRDPTEQIEEWCKPELQRLELRRAPLMRLEIASDPQSARWYALLQLHHITCDHLTADIVMSEVAAHLRGRARTLPGSVPYRNHVAQALKYAQAHDAEAFFSSKLAEIDEPTAPFGLLDVHGDGSRIEQMKEPLEVALAQRVRVHARRLSVSAATLFHAAWALVVGNTSGRETVVFGTVLLGRLQGAAGAQRVLGMFINTLPLRLRLRDVTAKELVEQTQRELVELLHHEQASLAVAQRCSGIGGTAPLFSALLNYRHSAPDPEADWAKISGIQVLVDQERTNYPITVSVDDLGEGFTLKVQTDRRIEPHRIAAYMQKALMSLVEALEHAPGTPALTLSVLPDTERHQIIDQFNATRAPHSQGKLIQELFEEQVKRTPDAVALVHDAECLTYFELNARANSLARHLRSRGVCPDRLVGICVERGLEMVIGLLGIVKAGGAYVPLDPNYPAERLQYMVADAAPHVLLTQRELRQLLPAMQAEVIELDAISKATTAYVEPNLPAAETGLTAQDLAYVIYTSGSTGRPKGTAMAHSSMVNLIEWHRETFRGRERQRVLQFAALSFDVAFQETFSTLCTGGTLVLIDEWVRRDARALAEFLTRHSIERLFIPPLMLQSLAEHCSRTGVVPRDLRDVITAGEQLRISPEIRQLFKCVSGCRLHNHYGPTETHVVTALTLTGDPDEWSAIPTIGRPISNAQVYVLSSHGEPVPLGVPGEIYLGGTCVARGYIGQPELTAQRFVEDRFSGRSGARLYRTGDVGRWRGDGTVEYFGRNDDQVKIRGFRIELGEIESQLAQHAQVKEVAVVAREDVPGEKRLVAYVITRDEAHLRVDDLRAHLKAVLPEYMVPSAFVELRSMPLTPSGKLDRRNLPAPEIAAYVGGEYEPAQGEVEAALATIWQELLRLERVGRDDNFFELGGHSLHGMKLIVRVSERFAVDLSVIAVFQFPTIRQMAIAVESLRAGSPESANTQNLELEEGRI